MSKSLVLIVGAGASNEVGLPVGSELRKQIAAALDIRYENGITRISGDKLIDSAFRVLAQKDASRLTDINSYLASSWRIRDAMPQAISIDNFINSHRNNTLIEFCGKLAIANCILASERRSSLFVDYLQLPEWRINFANVESTWFNSFFQLLTEDCQKEDVATRLSKIAVICFNYDRCIEHYLYGSLQNFYGMSPDEAKDVMQNLDIYHPYGTIGSLPWQKNSPSIKYGESVSAEVLIKVAEGIRTFTEGVDPESSDILKIREILNEAERLAFIGFAFHKLNVELLFPGLETGEKRKNRPTYATAHGISNADMDEIRAQLNNAGAVYIDKFYLRNDLKCDQLFREFWRGLSLH